MEPTVIDRPVVVKAVGRRPTMEWSRMMVSEEVGRVLPVQSAAMSQAVPVPLAPPSQNLSVAEAVCIAEATRPTLTTAAQRRSAGRAGRAPRAARRRDDL